MENKAKGTRAKLSFLKILHGDFSKQLAMPSGFTEIFAGNMPQWLIVQTAGTRKCWKVDLKQDENGGLFLGDGWSYLVEANALQVGYSLVFELKEQPLVELKIYDKDGLQRLECDSSESQKDDIESSEHEPKTSRTHHDEEGSGLSERTTSNQHDIHEKQHQGMDENQVIHEKQQQGMDENQAIHEKQQQGMDDNQGVHEKQQQGVDGNQGIHEKQQQDIEKKKRETPGFSSIEMSVSFSVIYKEVNHLRYYLTIPSTIAKEKKLSDKRGVILKDQDGKSWLIKLTLRPNGRVDFTQGWREFLVGNGLKKGDVMTFEFFSGNMIQVRVDKVSLAKSHPRSAPKCKDTVNSEAAAERDKPAADCNISTPETEGLKQRKRVHSKFKSSSFSKIWNANTQRNSYRLPRFVTKEQKLDGKKGIVLLSEEGKRWEVGLRTRLDGRMAMTNGWCDFWRSNVLATGDLLHFKFISDCTIQVNIYRTSRVDCSTG